MHSAGNFESAAGKNTRFWLKNGIYAQKIVSNSIVFKVNSLKSVAIFNSIVGNFKKGNFVPNSYIRRFYNV